MSLPKPDPTETQDNIERIRDWLKVNSLSQSDFAKLLGVSRQMVSCVMLGKRRATRQMLDMIEDESTNEPIQ
jgi:transcriptional regulator with XRE-family HTH domain